MLIGEYSQTLDAKGRVSIPAKFREDLGGSFVVSRGLDVTRGRDDHCVYIYPKKSWEQFEEKLADLPPAERRGLRRFFSSGAEECAVDAQGRVVIPPKIREYAGLKKEITVIGNTDKVEIWDRETWEEYMADQTFAPAEIAKIMEELDI